MGLPTFWSSDGDNSVSTCEIIVIGLCFSPLTFNVLINNEETKRGGKQMNET